MATSDQLLVVIDPLARRTDGESVRIAKDVLSAGARAKLCLPEGPEELARMLARRGSRRPVVVGDDHALLRTVALLYRQRALAGCALSHVPVGGELSLAHSLGVPTGAVAAARAVLDGVERRLDLLVDDSDGLVLGALRIPPSPAPPPPDEQPGFLRACQSLVRTLASRPARVPPAPKPSRLRVEADGVTLVDLDQLVDAVSVTTGSGGKAEVEVRPVSAGAETVPLRAVAQSVTVSGAHFRYHADEVVSGPVRTRTWVVRQGAWGLTLPR